MAAFSQEQATLDTPRLISSVKKSFTMRHTAKIGLIKIFNSDRVCQIQLKKKTVLAKHAEEI